MARVILAKTCAMLCIDQKRFGQRLSITNLAIGGRFK